MCAHAERAVPCCPQAAAYYEAKKKLRALRAKAEAQVA